VLERAGLKWVPFLLVGPAYATPLWFQEGPDSRFYRCLEHGQDSRVQSLFNPRLRPRVSRFLQAFAERYRDRGVLESVLLGITGIYGESLYPAGPEGGWTTRLNGPYHNHAGWWAGDSAAAAAFRAALRRSYGSIDALNRAWSTSYEAFERVDPFLPDRAPSDRARSDFVEWYQQAMTDWAGFWVREARSVFPDTPLYLCTGGAGTPMLGADFSAQAAALAPYRAGIRITNEGSDYLTNFSLTREVATAVRHYGTFCGFEPASAVDAEGIVARIYNASASGARQLHEYAPNLLGRGPASLASFRRWAPWLKPCRPRVAAALYLPRETWALDPGALARLTPLVAPLRDVADLDFLTRRSVRDGALSGYRVLVVAEAAVLDPAAAEAIEVWVRGGGTLLAAPRTGGSIGTRLNDLADWRARLLPAPARLPDELLRPVVQGALPDRWRLEAGAGDGPWLAGTWHGVEPGGEWPEHPGAHKRWSGPGAGLWLPLQPGADYELRLSLVVPAPALDPQRQIRFRIGGQDIGGLRAPGKQDAVFQFRAPAAESGFPARLCWTGATWTPTEHLNGSLDPRELGLALRAVDVVRSDRPGPPAPATCSPPDFCSGWCAMPVMKMPGGWARSPRPK